MDIPISFQLGSFNFTSGGPEDLKDAIVDALQATIPGDNVLLGKIGGAQPTDGSPLWLSNGVLYYLSGAIYKPLLVKVGTSAFQVTLISSADVNRSQALQNKDGIVALLSDIYTPRPTKVLTTAGHGIDWSTSNSFYYDMSASSNIPFTNSLPGQEIWLIIRTTTASKTVTFTGQGDDISWAVGTGTHTSPSVDMYVFSNVAGTIVGEHYPDLT